MLDSPFDIATQGRAKDGIHHPVWWIYYHHPITGGQFLQVSFVT
jgi:hypothetical protein